MSIKGKLSRMKKHLSIEPAQDSSIKAASTFEHSPIEIPFYEKWKKLNAKAIHLDDHYTILRELQYDLNTIHGKYTFSEAIDIVDRWHEASFNHPLSASGRSPEELLFFDTETTGLSSGAGSTIFLLGYSQLTREGVKVKQYFLPGPEHEVAMYYHFLHDVENLSNLVTYNGKAFDWPQVKTRHTFVRNEVPKLPAFGHFDLLHGARRLWKETLPSCKLSIVENEILKFERGEDTPGYMAPMLYFDFLHEPDPEYIEGVLTHNEWDVLSLISLYVHISSCLLDYDGKELSTNEKLQIGKWFEFVGEKGRALVCLEQLWKEDSRNVSEDGILLLTKLYKQSSRESDAIILLEDTFKNRRFSSAEIAIELSKLYEHHEKDYEKALDAAVNGLHWLKETTKLVDKSKTKQTAEVIKRIERLEQKIKKASDL
ncbi:ribonuclease H-like domain-containing protein [Alkalihalobacterium chitinilyticum]|uniref:Ribonuclease H-like domain-containing protein n=1 Tax=Alkalihalobacterium chitinilyticum TaxID=2980103 RepID=A0ABT5VG00_9BACI|nr:ribonuclease H-like domain-containing protein [Alkalihalobacterium chitinilyticum]MDE5414398.1 ribonuclease H-like domain-containing protein [Alkalihalobacterium chitinilyticum]